MTELQSTHRLDYGYFVEWKPVVWGPAVRWVLGDTSRFKDKRVLELGCRSGKMSCLFGLLGADVTGVDLQGVSLANALAEREHWGLEDRVHFACYDGDPRHIPGEAYDYIFSKSVLILVPHLEQFLKGITQKLSPGGTLLCAENNRGGAGLKLLRKLVRHRRRTPNRYHDFDPEFLSWIQNCYSEVEYRVFYHMVVGIRARFPCSPTFDEVERNSLILAGFSA